MPRKGDARPLADRFWEKVDIPHGGFGCWNWTAGLNTSGYGFLHLRKIPQSDGSRLSRSGTSNRIAWMLTHGSYPEKDISVCHTCDNPKCCNPAHLWLGTHSENMRDMSEKGRASWGERGFHAKLKESDIPEIRRRYDGGESSPSIARSFDVHYSSIYTVGKRTSWKHVPEAPR
jgi:hypothetical protein